MRISSQPCVSLVGSLDSPYGKQNVCNEGW